MEVELDASRIGSEMMLTTGPREISAVPLRQNKQRGDGPKPFLLVLMFAAVSLSLPPEQFTLNMTKGGSCETTLK